jgi:hypothetical protein
MLRQVALISETNRISLDALTVVAAAVQKQATRDLGPIWKIDTSVDAFASLEQVPLGYWQVLIKDSIPQRAAGIHLNRENGQPFALVRFSEDWSLTVSHEVLEMLVDPSGNRTVPTDSPEDGQGRVLVLIEVCDPSERAQFGYTVNGVLVSDFYTPQFFDPVAAAGVRYSFTGAIQRPRQVLEGGYISWWDPASRHVFQKFVIDGEEQFMDRGELPEGFDTLRSFTDRFTNDLRERLEKTPPARAMLTGALEATPRIMPVDRSMTAAAASLRRQIDRLSQ